ncbi:MAG: DinB family protein [Dehalococcoidia bacterium]|nr:DinB family protein [Dehalococcoidia bacterium]
MRRRRKPELLAALRESGAEFASRLRGLPGAHFQSGRYENGWNARQILAHVAAIEWTYANLVDVAKQAGSTSGDGEQRASGEVRGGIDAYNERQVAKRADATPDELLDEFERNRQKTIAAIEATPEELLAAPIRSGGGIEGSLGSVFHAVAVGHVREHLRDIVGG